MSSYVVFLCVCISGESLHILLTEWSSWVLQGRQNCVLPCWYWFALLFSPHSLHYQGAIKIYMKPPSLGAHLFLLFIPPGESRICHLRFYSSAYPRCQHCVSSVRPRCTTLLMVKGSGGIVQRMTPPSSGSETPSPECQAQPPSPAGKICTLAS